MKVAVTGANGFLGSHLVRRLCRDGHQVVALIRYGSSKEFIKSYPVEVVEVDYFDNDALREVLADVELVVHNAAKASDWGTYDSFYQANVELTKSILKVCKESQILKLIYVSTNAVLGEEDCLSAKSEDAAYNPKISYFLEKLLPSGMNHYKVTKCLAEQEALIFAEKNGLDLTVLRPVWVYGPREFHAGPYEYAQTVKSGVPVMPGTMKNRFHTVYVEDVALAVSKAAQKSLPGINIYNIGPKVVPLMQGFYGAICKCLRKKRPLNIPKWPLFFPVLLLETIYILLKIKSPPLLTRARLYMMYANNIYDVSKAEEELGFVAETDMERGVRKTVKWWRLYRYL